jgi:hypothetical protein
VEYKYTLFHLKTVLFISTNSTCSIGTAGQGPEQHTMWVHGETNTNFHACSIPSPEEGGQFHAAAALSPGNRAQLSSEYETAWLPEYNDVINLDN